LALDERLEAQTIADRKFRSAILALRWLLLFAYVALARVGIFDISDRALVLSAGLIGAYNLIHVWLFLRGGETPTIAALNRGMDLVTTSAAIVSLHDVRSPLWAVYFISTLSVAHIISRREMFIHVAWASLNYVVAALWIAGLGYDVSWSYVIVVAVLLQFMGYSAGVLAGGEERLRELIAEVAVTDSLTGLPNRRRFHDAYAASVDRAVGGGGALALMLIDVDHFKEINDEFGHPAGDDKLREVARALRRELRTTDLVARYGGDEFVVVAPDATRETAATLAERLRSAAAMCDTSVSIGYALYPDDAGDQDGLIGAADTALYRAKEAGRNCVKDAALAA
jgi:diguanylate cyclase (GGDEF)-like protein